MSRIGKQIIKVPEGTQVTVTAEAFEVVGPKGTLRVPAFQGLTLLQTGDTIEITRPNKELSALQGLQRTLLQNAITGVAIGWNKSLELNGVGMRAALTGTSLTLSLGFSHPVVIEAPAEISFQVTKNVITISGIDKQLVGETAANIRKLRKPEPYKGKGIKYSTEIIRRKAGKTGKTK